jgi:DNA-binding protein HU-beta
MIKNDLINSIAEKSKLNRKSATKFLNAFIDSVEEVIARGDKVQLVGFGSFSTTERAEKMGMNPRTKESPKKKTTKSKKASK